jgi:hypothetical protein
VLVIAEATWASLLLSASVNSSRGAHVRVPFLALAIPAVVAVVWSAIVVRLRWRWWWKAPLLAFGAVLGVAVSAGLIGALSRPGSWWSTATEPWTASGHPAAAAAGVAWTAAILAWGRGTWLGVAPPSFKHTVWSLACGVVAFIGIFAGRGDHHAAAFLTSTSAAGWLFFVFFPLAAAAAALARERELEETWLARSGTSPGLVWISVLALPMVGIGLIALLLAVIVGPGAPVVGRGVARVAHAIWTGITAAIRWLWDLLPRSHGAPARPPGAGARTGGIAVPRPVGHGHASFTLPAVVWEIVAVLAVVAAGYFVVRHLPSRVKWRPSPLGEGAVDEERSSLFSWGHLWSQLRSTLWRWPRRRRPAPAVPVPDGRAGGEDGAELASVRQAYRRFLSTARAAGRGRMTSETAHELETRLSAELRPVPADALRELTFLYHDVRYGPAQAGHPAPAHPAAAAQSDTVRAALEEMAAGDGG